AAALRENPFDIPFACIYSITEDQTVANLEVTVHVEPDTPISQRTIRLDRDPPSFFASIVNNGVPQVIDLRPAFDSMAILPVRVPETDTSMGFLLIGLNPNRPLDDEYRHLLDMIVVCTSKSFSQARAGAVTKRHAEALARLHEKSTQFFTNANAALREPLTLLTGPLESLISPESGVRDNYRESLTLIQRAGSQILRVLDVLQDYAVIEAKASGAYYGPVELSPFTGKIAETFRS